MTPAAESIQLALTVASAFIGAMTGMGMVVWWLSRQFNRVYRLITRHETRNVERFRLRDLAIMRLELNSGMTSIPSAFAMNPPLDNPNE